MRHTAGLIQVAKLLTEIVSDLASGYVEGDIGTQPCPLFCFLLPGGEELKPQHAPTMICFPINSSKVEG